MRQPVQHSGHALAGHDERSPLTQQGRKFRKRSPDALEENHFWFPTWGGHASAQEGLCFCNRDAVPVTQQPFCQQRVDLDGTANAPAYDGRGLTCPDQGTGHDQVQSEVDQLPGNGFGLLLAPRSQWNIHITTTADQASVEFSLSMANEPEMRMAHRNSA
jgi:hypothetical protein